MDDATAETCVECGFDGGAWRVRDAVALFGELGVWWRLATAGIPDDALNARPEPSTWSALEYGLHSALVTGVWRDLVGRVLGGEDVSLPARPPDDPGDAPLVLEASSIVADLEREGVALATLARHADAGAWDRVALRGGDPWRADAALLHVVHDATHHMMDVGRGLAALDAGVARHRGRVEQVNVSGGGVPKRPIENDAVGYRGLASDRQGDGKHHGRPFQALCLWSTEVIDQLQREGHPIEPGFAGENLTLSGLRWSKLRPGTRLRIGSVVAEISFPTTPCTKQTAWFSDGDFTRIDHDRSPGRTRWYAWVREPGAVATGDPVTVQP